MARQGTRGPTKLQRAERLGKDGRGREGEEDRCERGGTVRRKRGSCATGRGEEEEEKEGEEEERGRRWSAEVVQESCVENQLFVVCCSLFVALCSGDVGGHEEEERGAPVAVTVGCDRRAEGKSKPEKKKRKKRRKAASNISLASGARGVGRGARPRSSSALPVQHQLHAPVRHLTLHRRVPKSPISHSRNAGKVLRRSCPTLAPPSPHSLPQHSNPASTLPPTCLHHQQTTYNNPQPTQPSLPPPRTRGSQVGIHWPTADHQELFTRRQGLAQHDDGTRWRGPQSATTTSTEHGHGQAENRENEATKDDECTACPCSPAGAASRTPPPPRRRGRRLRRSSRSR